MNVKSWAFVAACGGLAGAANALLCLAQWPVPAAENAVFKWHVIPAGAFHGAVLALAAFSTARRLTRRSLAVRFLAVPLVTWIAGFVFWIPLNRSAFNEPWAISLVWPLDKSWDDALLAPLHSFGLVAGLYYLVLVSRPLAKRSLAWHACWATVSGVLGSLWWWVTMEPWYFSPLHGSIWGILVGAGAWVWLRREETPSPGVA